MGDWKWDWLWCLQFSSFFSCLTSSDLYTLGEQGTFVSNLFTEKNRLFVLRYFYHECLAMIGMFQSYIALVNCFQCDPLLFFLPTVPLLDLIPLVISSFNPFCIFQFPSSQTLYPKKSQRYAYNLSLAHPLQHPSGRFLQIVEKMS